MAGDKKRGAKPLASATSLVPALDGELLAQRHQEVAQMTAHHNDVLSRFGDNLPWNPDHFEAAIRAEMTRGCEAFLRAGRLLVVARECAVHGEWAGMLGRLGLEPRQAHRMMEAARRVAALPNRSHATDLVQAVKVPSRLMELLSLSDDQFTELAETGETSGLQLEELDRMSRPELRAAIREARADNAAKDERLASRDQAVNKLQDDLAKARRQWKSATPDEQRLKLERAVTDAVFSVRAAINPGGAEGGLQGAVLALAQHAYDHELDVGAFLGNAFGELLTTVRIARDHELLAVAIPIVKDGAEG